MASKFSNRTNDDAVVFFVADNYPFSFTLSQRSKIHRLAIRWVGDSPSHAYRFLQLFMLYAITPPVPPRVKEGE